MKNNNKFDKTLFWSLFFGGPLIFFIIWNRFIRIRLPREISPTLFFSFLNFIILFLFFFYFFFFIYYSFKFLKKKDNEHSFIKNLILKIDNFIKENQYLNSINYNINYIINEYIFRGPHRIYNHIYKFSQLFSKIINKSVDFLANILNQILWTSFGGIHNYLFVKLFCIVFIILPQIFPSIIFLVEILVYQNLEIFYKSLALLAIPLITNLLLFIIKHSIEIRLDYISEFYNINFQIYSQKKDDFNINVEKKEGKNFQEFNNYYKTEKIVKDTWINLQNYYNVISQIEICYESMKNMFKMILYFTYTLSFFFYFFILQNIYPFFILNNSIFLFCKVIEETKLHPFIWFYIYLILFIYIFKHFFIGLLYNFVKIKPWVDFINKNFTFFIENNVRLAYIIYLILYVVPNFIWMTSLFFDITSKGNFFYFYKFFSLFVLITFFHTILFICIYHLKKSLDFYARFYDIKFNREENKITVFYKELKNPLDIEDFKAYSNVEGVLNDWELFNDNLYILIRLQKLLKYSFLLITIFFILAIFIKLFNYNNYI